MRIRPFLQKTAHFRPLLTRDLAATAHMIAAGEHALADPAYVTWSNRCDVTNGEMVFSSGSRRFPLRAKVPMVGAQFAEELSHGARQMIGLLGKML